MHLNRTGLALSEYYFNFYFCRVVIQKFGFKVRLRYGTHTVWKQVDTRGLEENRKKN